ncbi:MAG: hypothetical protein JOZ65_20665 [Chloroflexi bacterium]|nr:hypothetical protein [Chloroflexota bacterium]
MRDIGIASGREPDVRRDEGGRSINLTFRGISDARSSVDRDTRMRIGLAPMQAARLWRLLGEHLTEAERRNTDGDDAS